MRDDKSLRRLAEIGVDVYVRRGAKHVPAVVNPAFDPAKIRAQRTASESARVEAPVRDLDDGGPLIVAVIATPISKSEQGLLADVMRALRVAGIGCTAVDHGDSSRLDGAAAVLWYGDAHGAAAWPAAASASAVILVDPATLIGHAAGKRAMWRELRQMIRGLAVRTERARR